MIEMKFKATSARGVNHLRRKDESGNGVKKAVSARLNSVARDCIHCSSLSLSSNMHTTAAGFPLNADSVKASTYNTQIIIKSRYFWSNIIFS